MPEGAAVTLTKKNLVTQIPFDTGSTVCAVPRDCGEGALGSGQKPGVSLQFKGESCVGSHIIKGGNEVIGAWRYRRKSNGLQEAACPEQKQACQNQDQDAEEVICAPVYVTGRRRQVGSPPAELVNN